jgi:hypothetical protein
VEHKFIFIFNSYHSTSSLCAGKLVLSPHPIDDSSIKIPSLVVPAVSGDNSSVDMSASNGGVDTTGAKDDNQS